MANANAQQTLVVGLGKSGLACARYLAVQGVAFVVTDSREQPPCLETLKSELPDVTTHMGKFQLDDFERARQVVLSPGVSRKNQYVLAAQNHGAEILGDIELFARDVQAPVIAITGTNGKSTVTTLVAEMAIASGRKVQVGGNLGMPALELLTAQDTELYVLELSSFQLETTSSLNAVAAVVLNIAADHMDRYADLHEYAEVKQRVYRGDGVMVINADDQYVAALADNDLNNTRHVVRFGLQTPGENDFGLLEQAGEPWLAHGQQALLAVSELKMAGRHNQANALAALALGVATGLDMQAMLEVLRNFTGLPHRTEWVAEQNGIRWYNDSKATNVAATVAAIQGMPGPLVLIAGGEGKNADFSPLHVTADKLRGVVLLGRDAALIEAALSGAVDVKHAQDMREAVRQAADFAQVGDSVMLSPACASFDMYQNFEERGADFIAAVQELMQ